MAARQKGTFSHFRFRIGKWRIGSFFEKLICPGQFTPVVGLREPVGCLLWAAPTGGPYAAAPNLGLLKLRHMERAELSSPPPLPQARLVLSAWYFEKGSWHLLH